jgi:glyoxylate carboligase
MKKNTLAATLLQEHNNKKLMSLKKSSELKNDSSKPKIKRLSSAQLDEFVQKAVQMLRHDSFNDVCKKLAQNRQTFNQAFSRRGLRVSTIILGYQLEENSLRNYHQRHWHNQDKALKGHAL